MRKRILAGVFFCAVISNSLTAQDFTKPFQPEYPIFGFEYLGYSSIPTAQDLLLPENLLDVTNDNGHGQATFEDLSIDNGVCSVTLLFEANEKKLIRLQFKMQSDSFAEKNYLTYLKMANLSNGNTQEIYYYGTQESLGEVLGGFSQLVNIFYDKNKLFAQ